MTTSLPPLTATPSAAARAPQGWPLLRLTILATATPDAIDLRSIAPCEGHALVFGRFDALQAEQSMQLVNDHDPQPLWFQLDDRAFGQFEWAPLESGPDVWRVRITRVGVELVRGAMDSCCSGGACCG